MQNWKAIDLFSGGGGSSYGARLAGVEIIGGVDAWDIASRTWASNFPKASAFHHTLSGDVVRPEIAALGPIDLLLASPECTNHTCARGARPRCEESRMTAWQVIHHARALQPRWIVIENVVQMRSWERFRDFEKALIDLHYNLWPRVLDASHFGVPQSRRRLFLICSREDKVFNLEIPERLERTARDILDPKGTWPTTPLYRDGRAQATIDRAERGFAALGKHQPFIVVYYGSDYAGGWQDLDRPLRTLTTLDRFALIEPSPNGPTMRMLQVPELRRAMGFGEDFQMNYGTRRDQIKLLGNGVCPPVMEHIVGTLTGKVGARQLDLLRPLTQAASA